MSLHAIDAIHQMLPTLSWGDAVGNQVRELQKIFRSWGFESEIYASTTDAASRQLARPASKYPRESSAQSLLVVHHCTQSNLVPLIEAAKGEKALIFHNITPAQYFEPFQPITAEECRAGRDELAPLSKLCSHAFAYSRFSAEELVAAGFGNVAVIPFLIDWKGFDTPPDPRSLREWKDGSTNVLFVGRAVPHKRIEDLFRVFTAYQALYNPRSRLLVAGSFDPTSAYGTWLTNVRAALGASGIRVLGKVSGPQLSACFASADVYLSMSQHEGFGVPLLEAMHRRVPVLAYGAAAVPETMGGTGIVTKRRDPVDVAQLIAALDYEPSLRAELVREQDERLAQLRGDEGVLQIRSAFESLLTRRPSARAAPKPPTEDFVVSVSLGIAPESPSSREALALARAAGAAQGATVLTIGAGVLPGLQLGPARSNIEGIPVVTFSPDLPGEAPEELRSSSLESALAGGTSRVCFAEPDSALARALRARIRDRQVSQAQLTQAALSNSQKRVRLRGA